MTKGPGGIIKSNTALANMLLVFPLLLFIHIVSACVFLHVHTHIVHISVRGCVFLHVHTYTVSVRGYVYARIHTPERMCTCIGTCVCMRADKLSQTKVFKNNTLPGTVPLLLRQGQPPPPTNPPLVSPLPPPLPPPLSSPLCPPLSRPGVTVWASRRLGRIVCGVIHVLHYFI